jgi:hypothetical protein
MKPSHLPIDHRWLLNDPPESSQLRKSVSCVVTSVGAAARRSTMRYALTGEMRRKIKI